MRTQRYIGIDYLRAFFSVCVVLIHLGFISVSTIFNKEYYLEHIFTVSDLINFYILLLAVPVFFIISNYLFFQKPEDTSMLYTYLKRIGKIAVFWIVLFVIFKYEGWDIIRWFPTSSSELAEFILTGGHTIYYFFILLIGLMIITHFSKRLNVFYVLVLFIITTLLVSVLPILSIETEHFVLGAAGNPLNFLPYPFAAILVFHIARIDRDKIKPIYIILAGILIVLFAIADWTIYVDKGFFSGNSSAIPYYTRPSLVLLAMVVLFIAIKIDPKRNPIIMFMSNNSLALYCLHPFFLAPANKLSGGNMIVSLFVVLLLSYLTAIIMRRFIQQELIK